jgi:peptidoglycan hydrolase CwlO-like protein
MNGASFWAAKADTLKSSPTSTIPIAESPKPTTPAQKKGLVLKGMANGLSHGGTPVSNGKTIDWADSDEDDDFIASFTAKKDVRAVALEKTLVIKDAQIGDLKAKIDAKDERIDELKEAIDQKDRRVTELEVDVEEKGSRINVMEQELKKQNI